MNDARSAAIRQAVIEIANEAPLAVAVDQLVMRRNPVRSRSRAWAPILLVAVVFTTVAGVALTRQEDRRVISSIPQGTDQPAPSQAIQSRIELSSDTVETGAALEGFVVIDNPTNESLNILDNGCAPKWTVVLTNGSVPPLAVFRMDCQAGPLVIPPGESRLTVSILASYNSCTADNATDGMPICLDSPPGGPPGFPPGQYFAVLGGNIPGIPVPQQVPVMVTPASADSSSAPVDSIAAFWADDYPVLDGETRDYEVEAYWMKGKGSGTVSKLCGRLGESNPPTCGRTVGITPESAAAFERGILAEVEPRDWGDLVLTDSTKRLRMRGVLTLDKDSNVLIFDGVLLSVQVTG